MRVVTEPFIVKDFEERLRSGDVCFHMLDKIAPSATQFKADFGDGYQIEITKFSSLDGETTAMRLCGSWEDRPSSPNSMTLLIGSDKVSAVSNQRGAAAPLVEITGHMAEVFHALSDVASSADPAGFVFNAKLALGEEIGFKPGF